VTARQIGAGHAAPSGNATRAAEPDASPVGEYAGTPHEVARAEAAWPRASTKSPGVRDPARFGVRAGGGQHPALGYALRGHIAVDVPAWASEAALSGQPRRQALHEDGLALGRDAHPSPCRPHSTTKPLPGVCADEVARAAGGHPGPRAVLLQPLPRDRETRRLTTPPSDVAPDPRPGERLSADFRATNFRQGGQGCAHPDRPEGVGGAVPGAIGQGEHGPVDAILHVVVVNHPLSRARRS
jgi:hypothetical protein